MLIKIIFLFRKLLKEKYFSIKTEYKIFILRELALILSNKYRGQVIFIEELMQCINNVKNILSIVSKIK